MRQLPIFVTLAGRAVILVGQGAAATAKRRLVERAGGIIVDTDHEEAALAFVAVDDRQTAEQTAEQLKARGILVNVVDQPDLCDFTTPAIIDRSPVLIAIGTGGASAGLAKALRQRLETLLPERLGWLATALQSARLSIRNRWASADERRRAIDAALDMGGPLDPFANPDDDAVARWLTSTGTRRSPRIETVLLQSGDPDDLTLRAARLLGQADHIWHDPAVPATILNRARADACRHASKPPAPLPDGLNIILHLKSDMN